KIQLDDTLNVLIILFRQSQSHGSLIFTQVARDDKISLLVDQRLPKRFLSVTSTRGRPSSRTTGIKDTDEIFASSFKPTSSKAPRFQEATVGAPSKTRLPSEYAIGRA